MEHRLGGDYGGEVVVTDHVQYDAFGRVRYAASPFLRSEPASGRYGLAFDYQADGTLHCAVQGPLSQLSGGSADVYRVCYDVLFNDHTLRVRARGPSEITPQSPEIGAVSETVFNARGLVLETSHWSGDSRLELAEHSYDRLGRLRTVTRYERPNERSGAVEWTFRHDSLGQLLELTEPGGQPQRRRYSRWGDLVETSWVDPQELGSVTRGVKNEYDGFGRFTRAVELLDGVEIPETEVQFFYDVVASDPNHLDGRFLLGRLSHTRSASMEVFYGYDGLGRIRTQSRVGSDGQRYTLRFDQHPDGSLRTVSFLLPDTGHNQETVNYQYDSASRVKRMTWTDAKGSRPVFRALTIDPFGRYRRLLLGNGVEERFEYQAGGRREFKKWEVLARNGRRELEVLGYDPSMRLKGKIERSFSASTLEHFEETRYAYDALSRLARVRTKTLKQQTTLDEEFIYDGLGNLIKIDDHLGSNDIHVTLDPVDRDRVCMVVHGDEVVPPPSTGGASTTAGEKTEAVSRRLFDIGSVGTGGDVTKPLTPVCDYRYDGMGNVTSVESQKRRFTYGARGQLGTISQDGGEVAYRYDAFGRIAEIAISGLGAEPNRQNWRYGSLVERSRTSGPNGGIDFIERTVPGPAGGTLTRRGFGDSGIVLYRHSDGTGNRWFTSGAGNILQNVSYRPFGTAIENSADLEASQYTNSLWNGGAVVKGLGLVQLGPRTYDPAVGRFLQRDPVLRIRSSAATHPYAFAFNDPVNFSDSSGLDVDPRSAGGWCRGPEDCPGLSGEVGPVAGADDPFWHWVHILDNMWDANDEASTSPRPAVDPASYRLSSLRVTWYPDKKSFLDDAPPLSTGQVGGFGAAVEDLVGAAGENLEGAAGWIGEEVIAPTVYTFLGGNQSYEKQARDVAVTMLGGKLAGTFAGWAGRKLFRVGRNSSTALVDQTYDLYSRAEFQILTGTAERVAGYEILGTKGLVGSTYQRNIIQIRTGAKGIVPLRRLINELEKEARDAGATSLRIVGSYIVNKRLFNPEVARRLGFEFHRINNSVIELVKVF